MNYEYIFLSSYCLVYFYSKLFFSYYSVKQRSRGSKGQLTPDLLSSHILFKLQITVSLQMTLYCNTYYNTLLYKISEVERFACPDFIDLVIFARFLSFYYG